MAKTAFSRCMSREMKGGAKPGKAAKRCARKRKG